MAFLPSIFLPQGFFKVKGICNFLCNCRHIICHTKLKFVGQTSIVDEINLKLSDNVMISHTLCVKFVGRMSTVGTITGAITLIKCTALH